MGATKYSGTGMAAGALSKAISDTFSGMLEGQTHSSEMEERMERLNALRFNQAHTMAKLPWEAARERQTLRQGDLAIQQGENALELHPYAVDKAKHDKEAGALSLEHGRFKFGEDQYAAGKDRKKDADLATARARYDAFRAKYPNGFDKTAINELYGIAADYGAAAGLGPEAALRDIIAYEKAIKEHAPKSPNEIVAGIMAKLHKGEALTAEEKKDLQTYRDKEGSITERNKAAAAASAKLGQRRLDAKSMAAAAHELGVLKQQMHQLDGVERQITSPFAGPTTPIPSNPATRQPWGKDRQSAANAVAMAKKALQDRIDAHTRRMVEGTEASVAEEQNKILSDGTRVEIVP